MIKYIISKFKLYLYLIFGNNDSKSFIFFLKNKWSLNKKSIQNRNGIILVDFFYHYPFVYFWSYLTNVISLKKNSVTKFI